MKMKATILSLVIILICSGVAWAEGAYKTIEVFFERVDLKVNGQTAQLNKDSLFYNDTLYVPIRSLSEIIGANVSWDNPNRSVNLDFIKSQWSLAYNASQIGIYQYITIENNNIMQEMIRALSTNNMDAMGKVVERFGRLQQIAKDIQKPNARVSEDLALVFEKLRVSSELIRGGWQSKNLEDYYLAWKIFEDNETLLNSILTRKLSE